MNIRHLLPALLPAMLIGQSGRIFSNLAADSMGSVYLTSSSGLRGPAPVDAGNVFRYRRGAGWDWFAPGWEQPARGSVDVSEDGAVIAVTDVQEQLQCRATRAAQPLSYCYWDITITSRISAPRYWPGVKVMRGWVQLSRNGRYAAHTGGGPNQLVDLMTGATRPIPGRLAAPKFAVADNGCALLASAGSRNLVLHCPDRELQFPTTGSLQAAMIDAHSERIAYSATALADTLSPLGLHSIDVRTGEDQLVTDTPVWLFTLSADGRNLLYLARASDEAVFQVFLSDSVTHHAITDGDRYPEGVFEVAITPDGRTGYAISRWNRVLEFDLQSGEVTEIVPRTPVITALQYGGTPGSMAMLHGTALSEVTAQATAPFPSSVAGVSIRVGNLDAPILSVSPTDVLYQVPFEATPGPVSIRLASQSPFVGTSDLEPTLSNWHPQFLELGPDPEGWGTIWAIHDDGALVTWKNRARPSETLHMYAVGLGQVSPPVATGAASPSNPPATVVLPVRCTIEDDRELGPASLDVRFAGLAPAMTGVYELSVRLPDVLDIGNRETAAMWVRCESPGKPVEYGSSVVIPVTSQR